MQLLWRIGIPRVEVRDSTRSAGDQLRRGMLRLRPRRGYARSEPCLNCKNPHAWRIPSIANRLHRGRRPRRRAGGLRDHIQGLAAASICGRVCPRRTQCRLVRVRRQSRTGRYRQARTYVGDWKIANATSRRRTARTNGRRVAVVAAARRSACAATCGMGYEEGSRRCTTGAYWYNAYRSSVCRKIRSRARDRLAAPSGRPSRDRRNHRPTLTIDHLLDKEGYARFRRPRGSPAAFIASRGENLNAYSSQRVPQRVNLMGHTIGSSDTPVLPWQACRVVGAKRRHGRRAHGQASGAEAVIVYRAARPSCPHVAESAPCTRGRASEFRIDQPYTHHADREAVQGHLVRSR